MAAAGMNESSVLWWDMSMVGEAKSLRGFGGGGAVLFLNT